MTDKTLPSARQLLRWAREDLESLKAATDSFFRDQPYTFITEPDPKSGDIFLKLRMAEVPNEVCKLASHALWDVKHALDHATCSAVRAIKGRDIGDLHFPIGSHPKDLEFKLGHIPKGETEPRYPTRLHDLFRSFEPYPTGDGYPGGSDEFVTLGKLANTTKHAVPLVAVPQFDIASLTDTGGLYTVFMRWGDDGEDRIGRLDGPENELTIGLIQRGSKVKMNLQIASLIAFGEVALFKDYPAGEILTGYADAAETIVSDLERAVFG